MIGGGLTSPIFYRDKGMSKAQLRNLSDILLKKCSGIIATCYPFNEKEVKLTKMFEEALTSQRSFASAR